MSITKQKKSEILKGLEEKIKKATVVVFVNFHGLAVGAEKELRKILRTIGAEYTVAKKTLIKKALEKSDFGGELLNLEGEIAVVVSGKDPLEPIKTIATFAKKNQQIKLMAGVFENKYIDKETVVMLGNIPAREVLLAQIVNIINSPIQGIVVALDKIANKKV